jgi:hypothetical protein
MEDLEFDGLLAKATKPSTGSLFIVRSALLEHVREAKKNTVAYMCDDIRKDSADKGLIPHGHSSA